MASRPTMPRMTEQEAKDRRRYEIEDAVRTLTRAEQIKADAKLMADVRTMASDLKRVAGREPRAEKRVEHRHGEPRKMERREGRK